MDEAPPTREELLRARADLRRQLDIARSPVRRGGYNPRLVAKLRVMLGEIDECLAAMEADGGKGS